MKRLVSAILVVGLMTLVLHEFACGHGGQYRGPGCSTPPNSGQPPPSSSGGSSGATGPAGPSVASPRAGGGGARAVRGGGAGGLQRKRYSASFGFERWEFWWEYNKDSYLNLKNQLFSSDRAMGTSSFLVGRSRKDMFRSSKRVTPAIIHSQILPCLHDALDVDHPDVLDSSVLAIARMVHADDGPRVLGDITGILASKYQSAQESACLSLGVLGAPQSLPLCRDLMFNTETGQKLVNRGEVPRLVRAFAALSMGLIGGDHVAADLMHVVAKENDMTQKDLIACAITALGYLGDTQARQEIVRFLLTQLERSKLDPFIRAYVPLSLGRIGDPVAVEPLVRRLQDEGEHHSVLQSCTIALGQLVRLDRDPEIVGFLIGLAREARDVQTRHFAFIALSQIGARDRDVAAHGKEHHQILRFYLAEIERPSKQGHLPWACLGAAVYAMRRDTMQAEVIKAISHRYPRTRNPSFRGAIAISLGLLNASQSADMLLTDLNETRDKSLQGYLCVSLGLMRWRQAAERVRQFVADDNVFFVQLQAAVALGLMGDQEAVGLLVSTLQSGKTLNIVSSAARALGQIGDRAAVEPLMAVLTDPRSNKVAQAFAVVALGLIGEKTELPWNAKISENTNYLTHIEATMEVLDIL